MEWNALRSEDQVGKLHEESRKYPILIFKYSNRCSLSRVVLDRLERSWKPDQSNEMKAYFLDLISYRSISDMVSSYYNVPHESPQVLVVKNGNAIYDESHFGISFDRIVEALKNQKQVGQSH